MKIRRYTLEAAAKVSHNFQSAEARVAIEIELDEEESRLSPAELEKRF